jgi:hypothetical protein
MLQNGADGFTSHPKEIKLGKFILKNPSSSAGFEPANLGFSDKHDNHWTTEDDSMPFHLMSVYFGIKFAHVLGHFIINSSEECLSCRCANHPHRVLKRFIETKVPPGTPDAVMAQTGKGKKKKKSDYLQHCKIIIHTSTVVFPQYCLFCSHTKVNRPSLHVFDGTATLVLHIAKVV